MLTIVHPSYQGNELYTSLFTTKLEQKNIVCHLDIKEVIFRDFNDLSIRDIQSIPLNLQYIISIRSLNSHKELLCTSDGVYMDTNGGRKLLRIQDFIQRVLIDKPDIVIAMADEVPISKVPILQKRLQKAMERSNRWLDKILSTIKENQKDIKVFGVVIPLDANDIFSYGSAAKILLDKGCDGIAIGGVFEQENDISLLIQIITIIREAIGINIPIYVPGISILSVLLQCYKAGATIISTNISQTLTITGKSWNFNTNQEYDKSVLKRSQGNISNENPISIQSNKVIKLDKDANMEDTLYETKTENSNHVTDSDSLPTVAAVPAVMSLPCKLVLDMWDIIFERDTQELITSCKCLSCRSHSRAYIHHLFKAQELLGEVLLYSHNKFQLIQMIEKINQHHLPLEIIDEYLGLLEEK